MIFLLIFGTGAQAGAISENSLTKVVMYGFPLIIVGGIAYRMLKKQY
jgi:hypothetical protein